MKRLKRCKADFVKQKGNTPVLSTANSKLEYKAAPAGADAGLPTYTLRQSSFALRRKVKLGVYRGSVQPGGNNSRGIVAPE